MLRRLVVLVVLALVLFAIDRGSAALAARLVGQRIQTAEGLSAPPAVHFGGFPFLTQVAAGRYTDLRVTATGVRRGDVRLARLTAHLRDVRVPPGDLISGRLGAVPVGSVDAQAVVGYSDLSAALTGRQISFRDAAGRLELSTVVRLFGTAYRLVATGSVTASGTRLAITPNDLRASVGGTSVQLGSQVGSALTVAVRVPLPFGLQLRGARVTAGGLVLDAFGTNITLRG